MRRLLLIVAAVAALWAAAVFVTGGIVIPLGFGVLRSRATTRALVVAVSAFGAYVLLDLDRFRAETRPALAWLRAVSLPLAILAAAGVAVHAVHFGTFTAGGADSYGYVSQAYGWARGVLPGPQRLALTLPFPSSDLIQIPLGYRPGPAPHTMVPTYAAGLPFAMALALVFGPCGPFAVVPLAAAAFALVTYALGVRLAGRMTALLAVFFLATSPVVIYMAEWPMSDVPAGAVWTTALVASLGRRRWSALVAGALTACGLLIRPNLVPVAAVPLACTIVMAEDAAERLKRAALFSIPVVVAATTIGYLNATWYGSPLRSGYGTNEELYSIHSVWPNLQRYPVWLWQSQSPLVLLAFVPLLRKKILPAVLLAVAVLACYISYFAFDAWWYLRFLLPGLGAFFVLMAAGLVILGRKVPAPWGHLVVALCVTYTAVHSFEYSRDAGVFGLLAGERRYVAAGQYVKTLPEDSVIFTMQHSGTVRFYGGRYSLRYDFLDRDWAGRAAEELEHMGLHPYLLIDDWEGPYVRHQFGLPDGPLPWPLAARLREFGGVTVYDLATHPHVAQPVAISPDTSPLCPAPLDAIVRPRR